MTAAAPARGEGMDERIAERREEVLRQRRLRRRRRWVSLGILVVVLALGVAAARSPLFAIDEVRVAGVAGERATQARAAAGLEEGENLLAADVGAAEAEVLALPWVATAEVVRAPPASVEIVVAAREPFAVVRLSGSSWILDAEGVVLAGGAGEGLVEVEAPDAALPAPGEEAEDAAVLTAVAFHRALPDGLDAQVRRYDAKGGDDLRMEVETGDGTLWVRLGSAEQASHKAEVVRALLPEARALLGGGATEAAELDVRVPDNPVLVPAEPSEEGAGELP